MSELEGVLEIMEFRVLLQILHVLMFRLDEYYRQHNPERGEMVLL